MNPHSPPGWKALARSILARDGHACQLEWPGCQGRATEVDHILPRAFGGSDHPDNLRAACARCNRRRHTGRNPPAAATASVW